MMPGLCTRSVAKVMHLLQEIQLPPFFNDPADYHTEPHFRLYPCRAFLYHETKVLQISIFPPL
jgi:hypothetical protein